jgi:hypothetical protein
MLRMWLYSGFDMLTRFFKRYICVSGFNNFWINSSSSGKATIYGIRMEFIE